MKHPFWSSEKILSLSALFISLLTLVVFIYQTDLIREQQYKSVYPHLGFANHYGGTLRYEYVITNEGIGPALVEEVIVKYGDAKYEDIIDFVDDRMQEADSVTYFHANLRKGRLIPAGEKISLIKLASEQDLEGTGLPLNTHSGSAQLYQVLNSDSLQIEVRYRSIYDEYWIIRNGGRSPEKQ